MSATFDDDPDQPRGVERLTVSLPAQLSRALRAAAEEERASVSRWVADAVQDRLLLRRMRAYIADYEAEFGEISDQEMAQARAEATARSQQWR
ncbi:MAG: hypothetical protein ACRD0K_24200 [Egibacteraceae bacterium]